MRIVKELMKIWLNEVCDMLGRTEETKDKRREVES